MMRLNVVNCHHRITATKPASLSQAWSITHIDGLQLFFKACPGNDRTGLSRKPGTPMHSTKHHQVSKYNHHLARIFFEWHQNNSPKHRMASATRISLTHMVCTRSGRPCLLPVPVPHPGSPANFRMMGLTGPDQRRHLEDKIIINLGGCRVAAGWLQGGSRVAAGWQQGGCRAASL